MSICVHAHMEAISPGCEHALTESCLLKSPKLVSSLHATVNLCERC